MKKLGERRFLAVHLAADDLWRMMSGERRRWCVTALDDDPKEIRDDFYGAYLKAEKLPDDLRVYRVDVSLCGTHVRLILESDRLPECFTYRGFWHWRILEVTGA